MTHIPVERWPSLAPINWGPAPAPERTHTRRLKLPSGSTKHTHTDSQRERDQSDGCSCCPVELPGDQHGEAGDGGEGRGHGGHPRRLRELGLLRAAEPWHLARADGRGGAGEQGALQGPPGGQVQGVRGTDAGGRREGRRREGRGLGEHLLRPPPPGLQPRRPARPRRPLQASDEGIRVGDREAGGARAGPAVREPGPGEGLPEAGLRGVPGLPDVRHQGEQLPAVPAAGPRRRPPRAHRRRRRDPAVPGRPGQRPAAAQGRGLGGRAADAPRRRRQHRRPAGGDHQRAVQERDAPRAHAPRRQPHVHRVLLQPRSRRRHLPRAGARRRWRRRGEGGRGGRRRRVPEVRVRGLHEPVRAPQVRGQGATLRGHEVGRRADRHRLISGRRARIQIKVFFRCGVVCTVDNLCVRIMFSPVGITVCPCRGAGVCYRVMS